MRRECELVVIGAGPAGLRAATTAAQLGVDVAVVDQQPRPGGQIFRNAECARGAEAAVTDPAEKRDGADLIARFRSSRALHYPNATVCFASTDRELGVVDDSGSHIVRAQRIIVATGAMERPIPFPGWTLPGVMTLGAAQVLLKSSGAVPSGSVVLAGAGPLLPLVHRQYVELGIDIAEVLEIAPRASRLVQALPHLPAALLAGDFVRKGWQMERECRARGSSVQRGVRDLRGIGDQRLEAVEFTVGGRRHRAAASVLLVHFGLIPATRLLQAMGCQHTWNVRQQCWQPAADCWGNTSMQGVAVAGDCADIGGHVAAGYSGDLAALDAARALGRIDADSQQRRAAPLLRARSKAQRARPFAAALFAPPKRLIRELDDDTIVCRCEGTRAGQIRAAVADGCTGTNQVKAFTRCGMGRCQGRQCASVLAQIVAHASQQNEATVPRSRVRFPVAPITLEAVAAFRSDEEPPAQTLEPLGRASLPAR